MIFECRDLERALRTPELMPDARAHAAGCAACRADLYWWAEISRVAPELHEEWESQALWPRIGARLAAEPVRRPRRLWQWGLAVAATVALAVVLIAPHHGVRPAPELLSDRALEEVERAETAYARSIDGLAAAAGPALEQSGSPVAAAYREKLTLLDAAIADARASAAGNRYNAYLRSELASLYGEKKKTFEDWMNYAKRN